MYSGSLHKSCNFFQLLLKQYAVYVHIICGPFTIRVTGVKVCVFGHLSIRVMLLNINRIQSNFMCNQLPIMCMAHGERT